MSDKAPMKKVDQYVFQELDNLSSNENYIKVQDGFANLEEKQQNIATIILVLFIFLIPLIVIMLINSGNNQMVQEFELKQKVIYTANDIIRGSSEISQVQRKHLSKESISTESALKSKISSLMTTQGIEPSKISTSEIEIAAEVSLIDKVKADLKLDNFSNEDLFNLIRTFSTQAKIRVDEINLQRSESNKLLSGIMTVYYYSKRPEEEI